MVLLLNTVVAALIVNTLPAIPFNGDRVIFPVVPPPMVRVLFCNDCIVEVVPVKSNPFPPLPTAEILAMGLPDATPVNPKAALAVLVEPNSKSLLLFNGERAPLFNCQKLMLEAADQDRVPLLSVNTDPPDPLLPGHA
jgi:hypothetical protein